jgi:large subunit ribosomal protein L25
MSKNARPTVLTLQRRDAVGTTSAQAVRRSGQVPGVVYGHGTSTPISIEVRTLAALIADGGSNRIVEALVDGKKDSLLLRDVQRDPISHRPLAADFQRVSQTEEIYATVTVVTVGVAPGVKEQQGILDLVTHALEIKGPAGKLPEHLTVDVSSLMIGDHITAGEVPLPSGFALVTAAETTVVAVETAARDRAEETPAAEPAGEAAAAEPTPTT